MSGTGFKIIQWVLAAAITIWISARVFKRSDSRALLVMRWILSALVVTGLIWKIVPTVAGGGYAAMGGIILTLACGWILAILWARSICAIVAKPFVALYDGGGREVDPHPVYSIAQAKRKRGNYNEAVAEIRRQLQRFPTDFEGQILLAEIQAEHLNDLPGAEVTIQRLCRQPNHAPVNIAFALNLLADWQLKIIQDRDAARRALEEIIKLLPDSEMASLAAQRIGHLASTEFLLSAHERKRFPVAPGVGDLGLRGNEQQPKAPGKDPAAEAAEYVKHLEQHPLDTEARERLALIYAGHYRRLDLATDQLEQLIAAANQPSKKIVHWLNLLADLQIRLEAGDAAARQTLQRIIDLFPGTAAAQNARNRLDHLKLELKAGEKVRTVKLGVYEQDIGLRTKQ